jgi:hypothetical protein
MLIILELGKNVGDISVNKRARFVKFVKISLKYLSHIRNILLGRTDIFSIMRNWVITKEKKKIHILQRPYVCRTSVVSTIKPTVKTFRTADYRNRRT